MHQQPDRKRCKSVRMGPWYRFYMANGKKYAPWWSVKYNRPVWKRGNGWFIPGNSLIFHAKSQRKSSHGWHWLNFNAEELKMRPRWGRLWMEPTGNRVLLTTIAPMPLASWTFRMPGNISAPLESFFLARVPWKRSSGRRRSFINSSMTVHPSY